MEAYIDNYIKKSKRFIFATYDKDRRLFKIRNRLILLFVILLIIKGIIWINSMNEEISAEEITKIESNIITSENKPVEETDTIIVQYKQVPAIKNEEVSHNVTFTNPYKVMLMAFSSKEYAEKYMLDNSYLGVKIEIKGDKWIAYAGPFEGYSTAKSFLSDHEGIIPKDSYISKGQ
jgi:hypothetical protein